MRTHAKNLPSLLYSAISPQQLRKMLNIRMSGLFKADLVLLTPAGY